MVYTVKRDSRLLGADRVSQESDTGSRMWVSCQDDRRLEVWDAGVRVGGVKLPAHPGQLVFGDTALPTVTTPGTAVSGPCVACPQCINCVTLPGLISVNYGVLFLDSVCGATPWSPGVVAMARTGLGTGCEYAFNSPQRDNSFYGNVGWNGTRWQTFIATAGAPFATTTSLYIYYGPTTPCSPLGTYSSPFSTSGCLGGSIVPSSIVVS